MVNTQKTINFFGLLYKSFLEGSDYFIWSESQYQESDNHENKLSSYDLFITNYERVLLKNPDYYNFFEKVNLQLEALILENSDSMKNRIPLLDAKKELKWIEIIATKTVGAANALMVVCTLSDVSLYESKILKLDVKVKKLEATIRKSLNLTEDSSVMIWHCNMQEHPDGERFKANDHFINTFRLETDIDGYLTFDQFHKTLSTDENCIEEAKIYLEALSKLMKSEITTFNKIVTKHNVGNEEIFIEHNAYASELLSSGKVKIVCGYQKNITESRRQLEKNKKMNMIAERLIRADKLAIKSGKVMVWFQDSDEFDMVKYFYGNDLFISKLGLQNEGNGLITRESYHLTIYREDEESDQLAQAYFDKVRQIAINEINGFEGMVVRHRNIQTGELMYCEHSSEVEERYENGDVKIDGGFLVDVTERINSQNHIKYIANHDILTGLYNRNFLEQYLECDKLPSSYMLIVCDLDGLKIINDAFGHLEGDKSILKTAEILGKYYGENSIVARMGGDEFLIISTNLDENSHDTYFDMIAHDFIEYSKSNKYDVSASIGASLVVNNSLTFDDAYTNAENLMYRRKLNERNSRKSKVLETILDTLNARSVETYAHSNRLAKYAIRTLRKLGYNKISDAEDIELLAKVHDIGKITVPDKILYKKAKLTDEEYRVIKQHTESGYKIVKNIINSDRIADSVLSHHERVDGKGYPRGLIGDDIPLLARIIAVCDTYDVMIEGRVYSKAKSKDEAIAELIRCSNTQFDSKVVQAFIQSINEEQETYENVRQL